MLVSSSCNQSWQNEEGIAQNTFDSTILGKAYSDNPAILMPHGARNLHGPRFWSLDNSDDGQYTYNAAVGTANIGLKCHK